MTGVLIKRGNLETGLQMGIVPCEHEKSHEQAKERPGTDLLLTTLRGNQSCQHLDFRPLVSRNVRQHISVG